MYFLSSRLNPAPVPLALACLCAVCCELFLWSQWIHCICGLWADWGGHRSTMCSAVQYPVFVTCLSLQFLKCFWGLLTALVSSIISQTAWLWLQLIFCSLNLSLRYDMHACLSGQVPTSFKLATLPLQLTFVALIWALVSWHSHP